MIGKEVSKKSIDYGKFINYHSRILIKDYTQLSKVVTKRLSTDGQKWSKIVFIESTKISKLSYNKARDLFQDSHVILQNLVNNAAANVHQADLWAKERVSSVEKESTKKQLKSPKKQKNKKLIFQGKSRPGVAKVYLCKE